MKHIVNSDVGQFSHYIIHTLEQRKSVYLLHPLPPPYHHPAALPYRLKINSLGWKYTVYLILHEMIDTRFTTKIFLERLHCYIDNIVTTHSCSDKWCIEVNRNISPDNLRVCAFY